MPEKENTESGQLVVEAASSISPEPANEGRQEIDNSVKHKT